MMPGTISASGAYRVATTYPAPAGQVCPLCRATGVTVRHGDVTGRACAAGHAPVWLSWPWESVEAYERRYETDYHTDEMLNSGRPAFVARDTEYLGTAAVRLRKLRELYPEARTLLDVGSGTGSLVAQAQAHGWDVCGLEPNPALAAWGRAMGRRVVAGTWRDANGQNDVVTLCDVFEHLTEPIAALEHLRECLTPRGVLVVEMPEYLAPGGDWTRHHKPLEHPCLYSVNAACQLFTECGLVWDGVERPLGGTLAKVVFYLRRDQ